jgi:hypothetical protein
MDNSAFLQTGRLVIVFFRKAFFRRQMDSVLGFLSENAKRDGLEGRKMLKFGN